MQVKRKFTDQQFLEFYNKGLNDRQIAEILEVSSSFITKTRCKLGLMPKNPQSRSNPKLNHEKIKETYKRRYYIQKQKAKKEQKPERTEAKRAYFKAYNMRPEVIAKRKARDHIISLKPEVKAKRRVQSKIREQKPERKAWKKAYNMRPEAKAKRRAYQQAINRTPEGKAKRKIYYANYKKNHQT
jgi:hypothetical protein